jgi:hypothetical protein
VVAPLHRAQPQQAPRGVGVMGIPRLTLPSARQDRRPCRPGQTSRTPPLHFQLTGPLPLAGLRPSSVTRTGC